MRSKAWLAAQVLLAHTEVTKNIIFFQWVRNLGTPRFAHAGVTETNTCGTPAAGALSCTYIGSRL